MTISGSRRGASCGKAPVVGRSRLAVALMLVSQNLTGRVSKTGAVCRPCHVLQDCYQAIGIDLEQGTGDHPRAGTAATDPSAVCGGTAWLPSRCAGSARGFRVHARPDRPRARDNAACPECERTPHRGTTCHRVEAADAASPAKSLPLLYAIAGELSCTLLLVALVFLFASHVTTQPFTPPVNPPFFATLSWLEAPISGASANPARSFGPELVGWTWTGWWTSWLDPALGATLAVGAVRYGFIGRHRPHQARLFHFGHPGGKHT